jgi:hypothetical protein
MRFKASMLRLSIPVYLQMLHHTTESNTVYLQTLPITYYGAPNRSIFFNYVITIFLPLCQYYKSFVYLLFVMSILISLCHNSEPLVHNSDRCFIIRTIMSILWRSKAIIINGLIYRRTMTTGLVARNNIDITVL